MGKFYNSRDRVKERKKQTREKYAKHVDNHRNKDTSPSRISLSIAVPGSILDKNTLTIQSVLSWQIARAAAIYNVDEVVVYDDTARGDWNSTSSCKRLMDILTYLDCPQYLRKRLIECNNNLKEIGKVKPLDAPHHLRIDEESSFRVGVVLASNKVDIGNSVVDVNCNQEPGARVTVALAKGGEGINEIVSLKQVKKAGYYWGYEVRFANSLLEVLTNSPHKNGYNFIFGTSDKGDPISDIQLKKKKHKRIMVLLGGVNGLEFALKNANLAISGTDDIAINDICDYYVNTCPNQGTRTIRTEEALLISLGAITNKFKNL